MKAMADLGPVLVGDNDGDSGSDDTEGNTMNWLVYWLCFLDEDLL